jgi:hypothetical protein
MLRFSLKKVSRRDAPFRARMASQIHGLNVRPGMGANSISMGKHLLLITSNRSTASSSRGFWRTI